MNPTTSRPDPAGRRGFAMLIVILIVALLSVLAAALLDLVNVDITLVGQHRRAFEARQIAEGATYEILGDPTLPSRLPTLASIDGATPPRPLYYRYAANDVLDPDGTPVPLSPASSAVVKTSAVQQSYNADICLVGLGPVVGSSANLFQSVTHELTVIGRLNSGQATSETRAEIKQLVPKPSSLQGRVHCR